jgi:anti-sigma factor RsiW
MADATAPLEVTCREFVEMATDYMEDGLPENDLVMVEEHLLFCDWCATYLEQLEGARRTMGAVPDEPVEDESHEQLLSAFRRWREERLRG